MKFRLFLLFFVFVFSNNSGSAQVSYGGSPLFPKNTTLRSVGNSDFIEMPAFDLDSVLILDEINRENMRGSYSFGHKFYTNIEKGKDGSTFTLVDGTKIWQVGIRSQNAYSLNILFTEFEIPIGGKLFIYNEDHSHIIGAFDHRNNSPNKILPIRPISGETIIIEYSEPANTEFEALLTIGEVNHDYRDILKRAPGIDSGSNAKDFLCMPDVLCEDVDETIIRSTVLLMIDGTIACTGTLVNNTENDETPYLLTAVHCLFSGGKTIEFPQEPEYYIRQAGSIVVFFNYNRAVCGTTMKATEEMSTAITYPRAIIEKKDIALLELQEKPPHHYNVYYAGWNVETKAENPPYTNLHHPAGAVKKYGSYNGNLAMGTFSVLFDANSHWRIPFWQTGATYVGSSGSPLFDKNNLFIGGLTGGSSACNNKSSDFFFALHKGWEEVKTYLDPNNTGATQLGGFDPFVQNPFLRISNVKTIEKDNLITSEYETPNSGFVFGNSNLQNLEFAEEFNLDFATHLSGVYLFIPRMPFAYTFGVEIKVYSGENAPEKLIASKTFRPQYLNYKDGAFIFTNKNTNLVATESFVAFDELKLDKKFFISYQIPFSQSNKFAVYNIVSETENIPNSAWIKDENNNWIPANQYKTHPISTSLAIHPLLRYRNDSSISMIEKNKKANFRYIREEQRLILPEKCLDKGELAIYSVSGQLIQKIIVEKGTESIIVQSLSKGTIYIVHFYCGNNIYSGKIIC
jgi:hypothetical protein